MIQQNEIITLFLTVGSVIFLLANFSYLKVFPGRNYFLFALLAFLSARVLTILEGFIFPDQFNLLEHFSDMIAAVFFSLWCWKKAKFG